MAFASINVRPESFPISAGSGFFDNLDPVIFAFLRRSRRFLMRSAIAYFQITPAPSQLSHRDPIATAGPRQVERDCGGGDKRLRIARRLEFRDAD